MGAKRKTEKEKKERFGKNTEKFLIAKHAGQWETMWCYTCQQVDFVEEFIISEYAQKIR